MLPFGAAFSPAASLTLPNPDNLPAGTEVDLWGLDPATGGFRVLGQGSVASASEITAASLITEATYLFAVPRAPGTSATDDENAFNRTPTALADGNLSTSVTLPSYRSLGEDRALTFVYNSTAADPRPIVAAEVTFPAATGIPPLIEGRLEVGGIEVAGPVFMDTTVPDPRNGPGDPPLVAGDTIRQAISFDASQFPTGRYPYTYTATGSFGCSKVSAVATGSILIDNQRDNDFGAGWTLAGLQSLKVLPDGSVLLTEGDGTTKVFNPESVGGFVETAILDTRAKQAVGGTALQSGITYTLTVDGIWSEWNKATWDGGACQGTPEALPIYPTPEVTTTVLNDRVGIDPAYLFAVPNGSSACSTTVPARTMSFEISLDGGNSWQSPTPLETEYDPDDHSYTYQVVGQGFPLQSRILSPVNNTSHGLLRIRIASDELPPSPDLVTLEAFMVDSRTGRDFGGGAMALEAGRVFTIEVDGTYSEWSVNQWNTNGACKGVPENFPKYPSKDILNGKVGVDFGYVFSAPFPSSLCSRPDPAPFKAFGTFDLTQDRGASFFNVTPPNDAYDPVDHRYSFPLVGTGEPLWVRITPEFHDDNHGQVRFQVKVDPIASPPGDFSRLAQNADGSFTRTLKDGTRIEFDAEGRQTARIDRNGNQTDYAYDPASGRLTSITDPTGIATTFDYAVNNLEVITDAAGRETRFVYDAGGNLLTVINADGSVKRFGSDQNGRLTAEVSERGFVTEQNYGAAGRWTGSGFPDGASITNQIAKDLGLANLGIGIGTESNPLSYARPNDTVKLEDGNKNPYSMKFNSFSSPVEITDPIGRTTLLERDADDQVTAVLRPNDGELPDGSVPPTVRTELDYDDRGNVTAQIEAFGTTLQRQNRFFYEPVFNNVTKIADATTDPDPPCESAGVTCFVYDAKGNLERTISFVDGAAFDSRLSEYDARGLETLRRDANGNETTFAYNIFGNLERVTDAEQNETLLVRDNVGRVSSRTEGLVNGLPVPETRTIGFTYDPFNRVLTETDGTGATTTKRYDAAGNELETVDPTDIVVTRAYDQRDRLILEDNPLQGPVTRTYDPNGNVETLIQLQGTASEQVITIVYDAVNRATKATDQLLNDRRFAYDAQDNLTTVTDPRTNITNFSYDLLGRQIRRNNPLLEAWSFAYDSRDNLVRTVDPKNQTIDQTHDELSRLTIRKTQRADGTTEDTITFTYDANGNRLTAKDNDSSVEFTYDSLNRLLTAETLADPATVQPAVLLTATYNSVGDRAELRHGPNELVTEGVWTFGHDTEGRLTNLVDPAGDPLIPVSLAYDAAGRLSRIDFPNQVVSQVIYDFDGRLERVAHTHSLNEFATFTYSYFADGLVQSVSEQSGVRSFTYDKFQQVLSGGFATAPESYSYDAEGNRTSSHLSTGHVHDTANRLIEDDAFCYGYDSNGNLITKTEKVASDCTGGVTTYSWDVENRLVEIEFPDLTLASYRYDALRRRIEKSANGAIRRYVYDGDAIVLQYDGTDALAARYSYADQVDQPLVLQRGEPRFYYHTDKLGSVRKVTNAAGTVVNSYDYDSFGQFEVRTEGVEQPYTFNAREFDAESMLFYYRNRYYDPHSGRFISEDPLDFGAGDFNLYRYVLNNSINNGDPSGLQVLELVGTRQVGISSALGVGGIGVQTGSLFGAILQALRVATLVAAAAPLSGDTPDKRSAVGGQSATGDDDPRCFDLYEKIRLAVGATKGDGGFKGLHARWMELVVDSFGLPIWGRSGSIQSHVEQFEGRQLNLRRLIARAEGLGCKNIPSTGYYWRDVPARQVFLGQTRFPF